MAILGSTEYGWQGQEWIRFLSLPNVIGAIGTSSVDWIRYITLWLLASLVIAVALVNAAFVIWRVATNTSGSVWPLRTLRAFVAVVLTALFVPLMTASARSLECETVESLAKATDPSAAFNCWGVAHIVMVCVTIGIQVLFVPFAVLLRASSFNDTPTSGSLVAKPVARTEAVDVLARTLLVYVNLSIVDSNRLELLWVVTIVYTVSPVCISRADHEHRRLRFCKV
jgi:hypothetical protein